MATPLDERTIGNPPYDESAAIEAARQAGRRNTSLRMILGQMLAHGGLQAGLAGLGSVPRGANFGTAFLAAAGGASRAQAALDQQRSLDEYRAQQQANEERRLARLEQEKPAKPEKPPTDARPWYYREEFWDYPGAAALRTKAEYQKPASGPKPAKPPKPEKPPKVNRRIPASLHKTEADLLHEIEWTPSTPEEAAAMPGFVKHLTNIMTGRAEYDSADLRRAAQLRLNQIQKEGR